MIGYLMNFFKYGAIDTDDFESQDTMYANAHEGEEFVRSVVWSVFDRLEIRDITNFDQFRLSQYSEKKWVGERQFTLLYEINPACKHLVYKKSGDKCRFAFHKAYDETITPNEQEKDETQYRFFGISMVDLAPEVHYKLFLNDNPGASIHKEIYDILKQLEEKNNINEEMLCYEIYGTLGGNDIVIIWLANEYKDVITMIEAMRKSSINDKKRSLISNIYTIMGLRDINNPNISYESVSGNLNIRLTKKGTYSHEEFVQALEHYIKWDIKEDRHIETTLGEHDLFIRVNGIELAKKLYDKEGLIRVGNDDFLNSILQSNTELSVEIDYDNIVGITRRYKSKFERTIVLLDEKQQVYDTIERITKNKLFDELPYLKETLWILYEDYLKNITSTFSYPWVEDLQYQFSKSIYYLECLVEVDDAILPKNDKYEVIRDLITTVRQAMLHVSQANRLFFEIPSTHLRNTGSYSKVLRTYYGIVKQLLLQGYLIPKREKQASIVPFITFDVIPKIESTRLPQLEECEVIIVNIVLPYEALVEIPKYAKLLAHEVFHYIAPKDREERNFQVGVISISTFFSQILKKYLMHILGEDGGSNKLKDIKEYFNAKLERNTLEFVVNMYEKLTVDMQQQKSDVWNSYFDCLDSCYSRNSMSFASKSEIHVDLFRVLKSTIDNEIQLDLLDFTIGEEEKKKLISISVKEFCDWIKDGAYRNITDLNIVVQYALREAMADYFMIQVMDKTIRIKDYYSLNLYYKDLLESDGGGLDFEQKLRIGIITDFLFGDIIGQLDTSNMKEILDKKLYNELKNNAKLCEERIEKVILCYVDYYRALYQYRELIKWYLGSLKFEDIKDTKFNRNLKEVLKLLNVSEEDVFFKSVQYIERFQIQIGLERIDNDFGVLREPEINIYDKIKEILKINNTNLNIDIPECLCAHSVSELINYIDIAINKITDKGTFDQIWFRGHSSYEYKLIPSLYRIKDKKKSTFYKDIKLREVINPLFKSFKVKAFGAKEIYESGDSSRIGILASMQHYSVPTNILDWTPAAFVALYFAVEKYMVYNEQDKAVRDMPENDAELWILNPGRLNHARNILTARKIDSPSELYPIPSIYDDEEDYREYIPFSLQESPYNLPVAVYVPHINQRIKAQLGTFTMFSLDAEGKISDDGKSVYFEDMVELQNRYYKQDEGYRPFLTNVRLSPQCVIEVADWLRSIGVTKPSVYPELNNISEVLTGQIKDYCKRKENKK